MRLRITICSSLRRMVPLTMTCSTGCLPGLVFRVMRRLERPVAVVADQKEVRDVKEVRIAVAHDKELTLLFDRASSLDERIFAEQFQV